jgi:hypothetical protein
MRLRACTFLVALAIGCAAAPPPPPPPPAVPAPPPPPKVTAPPPASISLATTAYATRPRQSYQALDRILASNAGWQQASAVLQILGGSLDGLVDVDHPMFLAMGKDKRVAVSIDVMPGSGAKVADFFRLVPGDDGGFELPTKLEKSGSPFVCAITPTPAKVLRLVCADNAETVRDFEPVLRTMTSDANGPDVRIEIGAEELRTAVVDEAAGTSPQHSHTARSKGEVLGEKLVVELANDLDAMVLDASITSDVDTTFSLRFRSSTSPFVRALTGHPERAAPPSPAFWRLPIDTSTAFFFQGADPSDLAAARAVLFGGLKDALMDDTCDEEIAYVMSRLEALFLTGGPVLFGVGTDSAAVEKALATVKNPKKASLATREAAKRALAGWVLFEVDEPASKWTVPLRELALADAKFAKCERPTRPSDGAPPEKRTASTKTDVAPVPSGFPKGTLHLTQLTKPTKDADKDARPAYTTHFFIVPDGSRTWFAVGEDEALLASRVKGSLEGAPESKTLRARPGLESLRGASSGGGFVTAAVRLFANDQKGDVQFAEASESLKALQALPSKGTIPMPVVMRTTTSTLATEMKFPAAAISELLSLAKSP